MNRLPIFRLVLSSWRALAALSFALTASAQVADPKANPPANLEVGGAAGPAPTAVAPRAAPPAPVPAPSEGAGQDQETPGLLRLGGNLTDRGDYNTAEIAYWQILHRPDLAVSDEKSALLGLAHMY